MTRHRVGAIVAERKSKTAVRPMIARLGSEADQKASTFDQFAVIALLPR